MTQDLKARMQACARKEIDTTGMAYYQIVDAVATSIGEWYKSPAGEPRVIKNGEMVALNSVQAKYLASKNVCLVQEKAAKNGDVKREVTDPIPSEIIGQVLDWHDAPVLRKVTSVPYANKIWQTVSTEGYDPSTQTYFIPGDIKIQDLTLADSISILKDLTVDMLFKDPKVDFANYLGYLLSPMILTAISRKKTPLHLFRKNQRGTGATTAIDVLGYIYFEGSVEGTNLNRTTDDDAVRKLITSALVNGIEVLNFDDYSGTLSKRPIVQYLTGSSWTDRKLQETTMLTFDNPSMMLTASGNNAKIGGDMARRVSLIEFYTDLEHPERRDMVHENLPAWIHEHRSEIISAFAALIRNWDKHPGPNKIGDFKEWTQAIAGILEDAGIHGFQDNRERIKVLDVHAQEQANFMEALLDIQRASLESIEGFTAEDFATWLIRDQDLLKAVPADSFDRLSKAANAHNYNSLSRWLTDHQDQSRSGLKIVEAPPVKGKTKTFKVVEV